MNSKLSFFRRAAVAAIIAATSAFAQDSEEVGFVKIFDGKSFDGWKIATENPDTWKIEDGAFVAKGPRSHLFYEGDGKPLKNFELKVEVMTKPGSNGGIYFHTKYQEKGWPKGGFECQVNCTHSDWKKTGSLYDVANLGHTPATDNKWWTQHIKVEGNKVTVRIDDVVVLQYTEPDGAKAGDFERKLSQGTIAFQAHDPKSVVRYRNIRLKRLAD